MPPLVCGQEPSSGGGRSILFGDLVAFTTRPGQRGPSWLGETVALLERVPAATAP